MAQRGANWQLLRSIMNYLAHVYLSSQTPAAITGAMLGDFVKGEPPLRWGPAVREAIRLHRAIDRYTDHHPAVVETRALVSLARRRFAGILIDMFFDHFLARHWHRYHSRPLTDFSRDVYAVLLPQRDRFPERLQRLLPWMVQDDWLASYTDPARIGDAVNGIARRFRYPERARVLIGAGEELESNYVVLEARFFAFFEELRTFAAVQATRTASETSTRTALPRGA